MRNSKLAARSILLLIFSIIILQGCKKESNPVTPPSDHFEPEGWILLDDGSQAQLVVWQGNVVNNWEGNAVNDTLFAPLGALSGHFSINFLDQDSSVMSPPDDNDYTFGWSLTDTSIVFIIPDEAGGWGFHLEGRTAGTTTLELQVLHAGHVDIRTPLIPLVVR